MRIGCIHTLGGPGCAPCSVSRHGRGGDCDVGDSSRIDRVWAATNPRVSSLPLRFVDPFLLFPPLFHALSAFLSSSSVPLSSFHLAFFVSLVLFPSSAVALVRSFFLPASPSSCRYNAPSLFLSICYFAILFVFIHSRYLFEYRAQLAALPPPCQGPWISRLKRSSRCGCNTPTYPSGFRMESQRWKLCAVKSIRSFYSSSFSSPPLMILFPRLSSISCHQTCRHRHLYELRLSRCIQIDT